MNKQEIFDKVITHLVTQKVRSKTTEGKFSACAYRGVNGTSCAVGCLISDEDYRQEMDYPKEDGVATTLSDILERYNHLPDWMYLHPDLLGELQRLHDHVHPFSWENTSFSAGVKLIATDHNLEYEHLINASAVPVATV